MQVLLISVALAGAAPNQVTFEVTDDANVQAARLIDGRTLMLVILPAPQQGAVQLAGQLGGKLEGHVATLPNGAAQVILRHRHHLSAHRFVIEGGLLIISYDTVEPENALRARVARAMPKVMPSRFIANTFAPAERLIARGEYAEATKKLGALGENFGSRAWSRLRLADITLLQDGASSACDQYASVLEEFPRRTSGQLARVRLYVLRCEGYDATRLELRETVRRLQRVDGDTGRFLWDELLWALGPAGRLEDAELVLASFNRPTPGGTRLRHATLARLVREETNRRVRVQHLHRYRKLLARHPEANSLRLDVARDLIALELPGLAERQLSQKSKRGRGALWNAREGEAQWMQLSAEVARLQGEEKRVATAADRYRKRFKRELVVSEVPVSGMSMDDLGVSRALDSLLHRVDAVRNAMATKQSGRSQRRAGVR